jgi:hypothetical protein
MKSKTSSLLKNPTAGTYLQPAESSKYLDLCLVIRKSSAGISARRSDVLTNSMVFLCRLKAFFKQTKSYSLHILPESPFAISLLFVAQPHKQAPISSHGRNSSLQTAEMSVQRLDQGLDV